MGYDGPLQVWCVLDDALCVWVLWGIATQIEEMVADFS
jgi:hypothetical protein